MRRQLFRTAGYTAFLVVSVSLGAELMVRILIPQVLPVDAPHIFVPDRSIGWKHAPGVRALANTGERDVQVCTDRIGDRISCTQLRNHCAKRVLVIGDSFVEALAVPFEETAWARLEHDTGACFDVAGVSGYQPSQYLELIRERTREDQRAVRYDVILVVLYSGNDLVENAEDVPPPQQVWRQEFQLLPHGLSMDALKQWFYPYNQWLESRSHAYVALRFAIRNARDPGDVGIYGLPIAIVRSKLTPQIVSATVRSFQLMAEEAEKAGAKLVISVVPYRNQVTDPDGARIRATFPRLSQEIDMHLVQIEIVPKLMKLKGAIVIDLLPPLLRKPDTSLWGGRDGHFSPSGHEVWFRILRDPIRRVLGETSEDASRTTGS